MPLKVLRKPGRSAWYLRGTINGKRYDESTDTTDYKIADAYRVKREHEIHQEVIHGKTATATFEQAALHYLEQGGDTRFMQPVLLHFGKTRLSSIGQEQIDAAAKKLYPAAQGATRNRQVYSPVSAVLHHAARLGWCPLPLLKRPKAPPGRIRWITKDEAARLLEAARPHMRPLIQFLLYTGARAGEALWLDWSDIDLSRRHVQFIGTKNGTDRGVPLHSALVAELEKIEHRTGKVFRRPDGEPYTRPDPTDDNDKSAGTRIKTGFKASVRRAGLIDFTPHDCRHTWATWHYRANRDLGALMKLGGWKTMQMVMRYAHTNVEELSHTIDKL